MLHQVSKRVNSVMYPCSMDSSSSSHITELWTIHILLCFPWPARPCWVCTTSFATLSHEWHTCKLPLVGRVLAPVHQTISHVESRAVCSLFVCTHLTTAPTLKNPGFHNHFLRLWFHKPTQVPHRPIHIHCLQVATLASHSLAQLNHWTWQLQVILEPHCTSGGYKILI